MNQNTPQPATGAEATAKKAKPAKEKKPAKAKRTSINTDGKVYFGKDKEGKKYGKENNPKRPGTATFGRFAKYQEGLSVKETCKIPDGPRMGDLNWDAHEDRRYIEIR